MFPRKINQDTLEYFVIWESMNPGLAVIIFQFHKNWYQNLVVKKCWQKHLVQISGPRLCVQKKKSDGFFKFDLQKCSTVCVHDGHDSRTFYLGLYVWCQRIFQEKTVVLQVNFSFTSKLK